MHSYKKNVNLHVSLKKYVCLRWVFFSLSFFLSPLLLLFLSLSLSFPSYFQDEIVHHSHGEQLAERCGGPVKSIFVEGGGHNDLELYPSFLEGLTDFVLSLATSSVNDAVGGDISNPVITV